MRHQTFNLHASFKTSGKPAGGTFLAVGESDDTGVVVTTDECFVVLNGPLEEALATLT